MNARFRILALLALILFPAVPVGAQPKAAPPTPQERAAALKANLAMSQNILHHYEWIETTVLNLKGEDKPASQNRCYYGADGVLQKVPVTTPPPPKKMRGLRGKIAKSKIAEMSDYMKRAVALMKSYLPPDPGRIQAARAAGKISITPSPDKTVWLDFADFIKPGDKLSFDLDLASNTPRQAKIASYLDSKDDAVSMYVTFGSFNNATYTAKTELNAPAKEVIITVTNSGYKKLAQ